MNSALVIASVTTALKNLLNNGLVQELSGLNAGEVTVSTLPPDRVTSGAEEHAQLNLYLYRLTPNSSWRRSSTMGTLAELESNSFLALDLHYLLTAYGEHDVEAGVLLGYAIQLLCETPFLPREALFTAFAINAPKYTSSAMMNAWHVLSGHSLSLVIWFHWSTCYAPPVRSMPNWRNLRPRASLVAGYD